MPVKHEPLTWEVLDYWRQSGLPISPIIDTTLVVSRASSGDINGFAAIGNHPDAQVKLLIEPLVASSGPVAVKVIDCLEKLLMSKGMPGYAFYITPGTRWARQIRRLHDAGIFHKLGSDESYEWYARRF